MWYKAFVFMNESLWTHLVGVIMGRMKNEEEKSVEKIMFVDSFGWSDYREDENWEKIMFVVVWLKTIKTQPPQVGEKIGQKYLNKIAHITCFF